MSVKLEEVIVVGYLWWIYIEPLDLTRPRNLFLRRRFQ